MAMKTLSQAHAVHLPAHSPMQHISQLTPHVSGVQESQSTEPASKLFPQQASDVCEGMTSGGETVKRLNINQCTSSCAIHIRSMGGESQLCYKLPNPETRAFHSAAGFLEPQRTTLPLFLVSFLLPDTEGPTLLMVRTKKEWARVCSEITLRKLCPQRLSCWK